MQVSAHACVTRHTETSASVIVASCFFHFFITIKSSRDTLIMMISISRDHRLSSTSLSDTLMTPSFCVFLFFALCACEARVDEIVVRVREGVSPELLAKQYGMRLKRKVSTFTTRHECISVHADQLTKSSSQVGKVS